MDLGEEVGERGASHCTLSLVRETALVSDSFWGSKLDLTFLHMTLTEFLL